MTTACGSIAAVGVALRAHRLTWGGVPLERLRLSAHGVRIRPGLPAHLHVRRVVVDAALAQRGIDSLLARGLPYAHLRLGDDTARAVLANRPDGPSVELAALAVDGALRLQPVAVVLAGGRRLTAPARLLPRIRIGSEVLLPGSRLVAARIRGGRLELSAELDEWSTSVPPLELLSTALASGRRLPAASPAWLASVASFAVGSLRR